MPKLAQQDVARNRATIESAALRLFTRQGYHGTSVREIADAAGVSIGNIYTYYPTKQEIFRRVVESYEARIEALRRKALGSLDAVFEPPALRRLAKAIREIVCDNTDYWRLMYIDVIEFGSRHFAPSFASLAKTMKRRLGHRLTAATRRGPWNDVDPALAFTALYLNFFTYFLVETLFGGKQHLGMPEKRAIDQMIKISTEGLWREPWPARGKRNGRGRR